MPNYKTAFDVNWCTKYTWVRENANDKHSAFCKLCKSEFSVANRGEGALQQHQKTKKHEAAANSAANSILISDHFKSMFFSCN